MKKDFGREADYPLEQSALGAVLVAGRLDAATVERAFDELPPRAFRHPRHRQLWRIMRSIHAAEDDIDPVTIMDSAGRAGVQSTIGGMDYIAHLLDIVPSPVGLPSYVRRLKEDLRAERVSRAISEFSASVVEVGYRQDRASAFVEELDELVNADVDPLDAVIADDWPTDLSEIPRREWLVPGWIPRGRVTLLTGDGASGKSLLTLQLAIAVASSAHETSAWHRRWLPLGEEFEPRERPDVSPIVRAQPGQRNSVLLATWEDEYEEMARRRIRVRAPWDIEPGMLKHMSLRKLGALWGPDEGVHVSTKGKVTDTGTGFAHILERLDPRPSLVIVDPVAAAYGSDENSRNLVRQFVSVCDDWADANNCAILLVAHPSKQSILSGSTDWRNGPRAVLTLESSSAPDAFLPKADGKPSATRVPAVRLRLDKANYASAGKQCWVRKAKASDMDEDGWGRRLTMLRLEECTSYESAVAHAVETGAPSPVPAGGET